MFEYLQPVLTVTSLREGVWFGALRNWSRGRQAHDARSVPIYFMIMALICFASCAVMFLGFHYDADFVVGNLSAVGAFLAIAAAVRWIGFPNIAGLIESWMLLLTASALTAISAFIAAALNRPTLDGALATADRLLFGFSRDVLAPFATEWASTFDKTVMVYNTLSPQPFLLLAILFAVGKSDQAWRFLMAWCAALAICLAVSPFTPAHGTPPLMFFNGSTSLTVRETARCEPSITPFSPGS